MHIYSVRNKFFFLNMDPIRKGNWISKHNQTIKQQYSVLGKAATYLASAYLPNDSFMISSLTVRMYVIVLFTSEKHYMCTVVYLMISESDCLTIINKEFQEKRLQLLMTCY